MSYKDKAAQRAYQREWRANRRDAWIKEHGPCTCGAEVNLEVHHRDPSKKVSHRVWSWTKEKREAELAKCEVQCNTCHKIKTAEYRRQIADEKGTYRHGTQARYSKPGCRCALCCEAHRNYINEWRRTHQRKS